MKQVFELVNRPRYQEAVRELEKYIQSGNGKRVGEMWDEVVKGPNRVYEDDRLWKSSMPYFRDLGESLQNTMSADERKALVGEDVGGILTKGWALEGFEKLLMTPALRSFLDRRSPWLAQFGVGDYPGESLSFPLERVSWFVNHDDVERLRRELGDVVADSPDSARTLAHFAGLCLHRRELSLAISLS